MLTKVIAGDRYRKTRWHDEKGNFVGWKKGALHSVPALCTAVLRVAVGYRPELPWIAFHSIRTLERYLTPRSRVLEFGSGMSTVWYARRAGAVCSVEHDRGWYEQVSQLLKRRGLHNVEYCLAENRDDYVRFKSDDPIGFDLIMVDGRYRSECVLTASSLLRPGGILYLDNTDKDSSGQGGDMRIAEARALELARQREASVEYVVDLAPLQLLAGQALIVRLPQSDNAG
ncbi:MAG TPA: class I SAM-dependent methyltransferase [Burkholderiaceae bacterium]|nr:class I SAM-dependent methyltransferase [Burkholderiaceae bacterium]